MAGPQGVLLFDDEDSLTRGLSRLETPDAVTLRTAPDAALRFGPRYLMAVIERAGATDHDAVIDCGDDAGLVLRALAAGWRGVAFCGSPELMGKLASIARQTGATITQ